MYNKDTERGENRMLYLMLDKSETKYNAKVGLARKPSVSRREYLTYNPCAIMRSTCAGTANEELSCWTTLSKISIGRVDFTQWFEVDEKTFNLLYEKGMGLLRPNQKPIHFLETF